MSNQKYYTYSSQNLYPENNYNPVRNYSFKNPPSNYLHVIKEKKKEKGEHLVVFKEYKPVHFCACLYCFFHVCKYKIYSQMKFELAIYPNRILLYFPFNHIMERLPGIAEGLSKIENAK